MDLYHVLACFQRTGSATSVNTTGFTAFTICNRGETSIPYNPGVDAIHWPFCCRPDNYPQYYQSALMPEATRGPCVGTMSQCIGMQDREIQSKENQQGYVAHSTFTLLQTLCCFEALSAKLHYRKTDSKLLSLHCHTYIELFTIYNI